MPCVVLRNLFSHDLQRLRRNFVSYAFYRIIFIRHKKLKKLLHFLTFLNILNVTELPEVFLTLGTKLRLVLSFFTLRSDFMDLKKPLTFDEQLDKLATHGMIITDREKLL